MKKVLLVLVSFLLVGQAKAQMFPSFADLIEKLNGGVVNISTTHNEDLADSDLAIANDANMLMQKQDKRIALGSGFLLDDKGYIITNGHVIDKAITINVTLADNSLHTATIIGVDKKTDIALIKISTDKVLSPVKLGDSDKIRVGDWVLAIGNPFGLGGSVSAGIVSAKSRDIESGPYDNFIQTDASINMGSSGGPMFNTNGEVIGMNTAIFSTSGGSIGVGFAIPVDTIKSVVRQLKDTGEVKRGWVGIGVQQNEKGEIMIANITPSSPSEKAGIKVGDIITAFDGQAMDSGRNLSRIIADTPIGKLTKIEVLHDGQKSLLDIEIAQMPNEEEKPSVSPEAKPTNVSANAIENRELNDDGGVIAPLDIRVDKPNFDLLETYNLPTDSRGIMIMEVGAGSDASNKGLRVGDLIVKVDNKDVFEIDDIRNYVMEAKSENNRPVLLLIQSEDVANFVAIRLK